MFCSRLALSLPQVVTFGNGSTITYFYAADGTKVRTVHVVNGATTQTDYCGNVIYENGVQKLLLTEEGYYDFVNGGYCYYLKDHQGNNRVVINGSGAVKETNHYYPFGGLFAGTYINKNGDLKAVSESCLLIIASQWVRFKKQLNGVKNLKLQINRE